ncbi:MAG TPA: DNA/RNA non-specific endonuclease [Prolixibacteraceae bacterium]|nr:DNA/RNA non-specific endonuclease [Prolixibacteraceae bacterium]
MKRIVYLFAGVFCTLQPLLAQENQQKELMPSTRSELVAHTYYVLNYSEENEQADWVFYRLTPDFILSDLDRTEDFREDPQVPTGSATLADYKGSGYDRGHLCPAADMKLNDTSISESFFLSNMSPQNASFNRGIWSKLESLVRDYCLVEDTLYIATGPVFKNDRGTIGNDSVTVPGYFYKAIYDPTGDKKMIAFVLPNEKRSDDLSAFVISVDSLELLTGIDFFPGLPDDLENKLEKQSDITLWNNKITTATAPHNQPIQIYPNPASDHLVINGIVEMSEISICDVWGRVVYQQEISVNETIPIEWLNPGIYQVTIQTHKGSYNTSRFVKR